MNDTSYTWSSSFVFPYESEWSMREKFCYLNALPLIEDKEAKRYISVPEDYCSYNKIRWYPFREKGLRACPKCIQSGYHSIIHDLGYFEYCFIHTDTRLVFYSYEVARSFEKGEPKLYTFLPKIRTIDLFNNLELRMQIETYKSMVKDIFPEHLCILDFHYHKNKKWKILPCLPEERYGAIGLMHSSTYHIYIFGGIESESGKYQKGVLKIGLPSFIEWEFINIKQNESYFQRAFSLITSNSLNNFFILGGQKEGEGDINDILVMEINNDHFDIKESKLLKLPSKMSFRYYKASMYDELDHTLYYYNENEDRQIVKINPNTFEVSEFTVGIKKLK